MINARNTEVTYLKDYQVPAFLVETIDLQIELEEKDTKVRSELSIKQNPAATRGQPLVLHGESQALKSVTLNEKLLEPSSYQLTTDRLVIENLPEAFTLEIISVIQPQENTQLSGLYRSGLLFCTQCEAEGFRRITYYPDRPDVLAKFRTTILADKTRYPVLLSNGNLIEKGDLENNRHYVIWEDPFKKPSYLFALVAGPLVCIKDFYETNSGRKVALEIFVEPGNESKCDFAMQSLKRAFAWDESTYGLEYDLDIYMIVAVNDFNMGAMENKGLNIFNAKYVLADLDTATDFDFQQVEAVIGHEYFHNWTGNRVTCRDWFQLSLKEGLTVFREQQFSESCRSSVVKRIEDVQSIRTRQFPEDKGPMAHPVRPHSYMEINNFYTMTVYYKGSEVIRMMHTLLGEENFRKGIDLYFARHDGQAVTTDDFAQAMMDASQFDLTQFKRWYTQAGTPLVKATDHYDEKTRTYQLTLTQTCSPTPDGSPKLPFLMPVKVTLLTHDGKEIKPKTSDSLRVDDHAAILVLKEPSQTYVFTDIPSKPIPSLFGHFSAPVISHYPYTNEQLAILMAHDYDPLNRWDASQQLLLRVILKQMHHNQSDLHTILPSFRKILENPSVEPALIGEMLKMPSLEYLGEELEQVPIVKLIEARRLVQKELAHALYDELKSLYLWSDSQDNHTLTPEGIQFRALKNTVLSLLCESKSKESLDFALKQYKTSVNMTDAMGALSAMNDFIEPARDECFDDFYHAWQNESLVVNKWLGLQASQDVDFALEKVKSLCRHAAFDFKNPNKVYALIGGFVQRNPQFHIDHEGYEFLAEKIIALNESNPQVASRMLEPLSFYKRYEDPNGIRMKLALEKIMKTKGLSPDVFEIVTKALN